jgi:hypothetical protein
MATAASLNATSAIINGQGLAINGNMLSAISTFQGKSGYTILSTIYATATTDSNVANILVPIIDTIGSTATQAQFLIDVYPGNITPVTSVNVSIARRFSSNLISASGTILNQANGPFVSGLANFANVLNITIGYASSVFDTVASIKMLETKTYGQSGLAYTGLTDLVTGGVGGNAGLLGNVISYWGTMYNITNINLIADPYVFGQNLLDQGFGAYGDLDKKLTATGLDTTDITKIPSTVTSITQQTSTLTTQSLVGETELPFIANIVSTNTVIGNSPDVVTNIYKTITGSNLSAIISGTGFTTNSNIETLADLLDFNKVVNPSLLSQLNSLGINDFTDFTAYLHSRVGESYFTEWSKLSNFLTTISVPTFVNTVTTGTDLVLKPTTITSLRNQTGTGTGPFGNPVMLDYLGAASGTPYTTYFNTINGVYNSLIGPVYTALEDLNTAIIDTYTDYASNITPGTDPETGEPTTTQNPPRTDWVITAVQNVDSALNGLSGTPLDNAQRAYYNMLNALTTEVNNLSKAGVIFDSASSSLLLGLGQRIGSLGAPDPLDLGTDRIIANLITNDEHGDTIRAAISENINTGILGSAGITVNNDPDPVLAIGQAKTQNIPLNTYISQNK